jgi:hypothetical protein
VANQGYPRIALCAQPFLSLTPGLTPSMISTPARSSATDRLEVGRPRRCYACLVIRDDGDRNHSGAGQRCLRQFDERSRGSALGWRHLRSLTLCAR